MKHKGFTLIELMIVIAIIILLVAVAIPQYARIQDRARIAAVENDLKGIATAIESFYSDWGKYPATGYNILKSELAQSESGATINVTGKTTLTGEPAPISYISVDAFTALENKVGGSSNVTYTLNGNAYTLSATVSVGGGTKTVTCTNGGVIKVN
ncbi:MAG: prepilin-type N-terminal cleavage/methylation domain-containing protein [Conexivisphaerales archaeon]